MIQSAEEFIALRTSEDHELYTRAAHDSASDEVWRQVIETYPEMKIWVVHNKTVPVSILELLARDDDPAVRGAVARKRKAGSALLEKLACDPDESVRLAVAYNAKTPLSVLRLLTSDSWEQVATTARRRIEEKR